MAFKPSHSFGTWEGVRGIFGAQELQELRKGLLRYSGGCFSCGGCCQVTEILKRLSVWQDIRRLEEFVDEYAH